VANTVEKQEIGKQANYPKERTWKNKELKKCYSVKTLQKERYVSIELSKC
jgi:hypothetical protein